MKGKIDNLHKEIVSVTAALSIAVPPLTIWAEKVTVGVPQNEVWVQVMVKGHPLWAMTAFGLGNGPEGISGVDFDNAFLTFIEASKGNSTQDWNLVGGNEISPGRLVVGGASGSAEALEGEQVFCLFFLKFTKVQPGLTDIVFNNYTDDLGAVTPKPYTMKVEIE
jgi:hypothetical protein